MRAVIINMIYFSSVLTGALVNGKLKFKRIISTRDSQRSASLAAYARASGIQAMYRGVQVLARNRPRLPQRAVRSSAH